MKSLRVDVTPSVFRHLRESSGWARVHNGYSTPNGRGCWTSRDHVGYRVGKTSEKILQAIEQDDTITSLGTSHTRQPITEGII